MIRTSHSVSIFLPSAEACVGNQLISRPSAMPSADAITPMTTSGTTWLRPDFCSPMGAASYATGATEGTAAEAGLGGARQGAVGRGRSGIAPVGERGPVSAEGGGREALVAAEGLGELGRLAVADAARDLAHGQAAPRQQLGRALHPDTGEVLAERRVADLGVRALELAARGGDAARDVVEGQVRAVLGLDDLDGILEEAGPVADGVRALNGHATDTPARANGIEARGTWRVAAHPASPAPRVRLRQSLQAAEGGRADAGAGRHEHGRADGGAGAHPAPGGD